MYITVKVEFPDHIKVPDEAALTDSLQKRLGFALTSAVLTYAFRPEGDEYDTEGWVFEITPELEVYSTAPDDMGEPTHLVKEDGIDF